MGTLDPQLGEAGREAEDRRSPAGGSPAGSSPKHSQTSMHAAPRPAGASSEEELEPLPPHVARLTRQSVELIEQVNRAGLPQHSYHPAAADGGSCRPPAAAWDVQLAP